MRDTPERHRNAAYRTVEDIRRKTRKRYSSEDKIRVVAEQTLELRLLKKSMLGDGEDIE